ncbi:MAG: hypothetical protein AAGB34_01345 [Planctomycetota bacterium]
MEFLDTQQTQSQLEQIGLVYEDTGEGDDTILSLKIDDDEERIVIISAAETLPPGVDAGAATVVKDASGLGAAAEKVLGVLHVGEAILIPAKRWRDVLDVAAFDLATHEEWLDVDSEATLHQNRRDPLAVPPFQKHIVGALLNACAEHGESEGSNLFVTTMGSKLVIEAHYEGYLRVHLVSDAVLDTLLAAF